MVARLSMSLVVKQWVNKSGNMGTSLLGGDNFDPGPLLPPQQVARLIERLVIPGFAGLARLEGEGKVLGGGICSGQRAGAFIVEIASNEDLNRLLLPTLPFWDIVKWHVTPLRGLRERPGDEWQS